MHCLKEDQYIYARGEGCTISQISAHHLVLNKNMALCQLKDKLMLLKRGDKCWCMVQSLPPCPMQLLSQVMTIIYDCHGRHGGDAPHAFWVDEPRGKGVSGMQAERASVNGCKLQGGERQMPCFCFKWADWARTESMGFCKQYLQNEWLNRCLIYR